MSIIFFIFIFLFVYYKYLLFYVYMFGLDEKFNYTQFLICFCDFMSKQNYFMRFINGGFYWLFVCIYELNLKIVYGWFLVFNVKCFHFCVMHLLGVVVIFTDEIATKLLILFGFNGFCFIYLLSFCLLMYEINCWYKVLYCI